MRVTADSHNDHGLTEAQFAYIVERFGHVEEFLIETFELPEYLGSVSCGLHGPVMGDAPVDESEVTYVARPNRDGVLSRMCDRPTRSVREVTVIIGPEGDEIILFTVFGGPLAPWEPGDSDIPNAEKAAESRAFWAVHALSAG